MKKFEYEITTLPSEKFTHLVYFCTEKGECDFGQVPSDEINILETILKERGSEGWELTQINFGDGGAVAFWKREL